MPLALGTPVDFSVYLRARKAIATLTFGLWGSLVGVMAFRETASSMRM